MVHDPLPEAAAAVLVAIGRWKHGLNLHLKRSLVQLEMPQGADEEATRLVSTPPRRCPPHGKASRPQSLGP
eukprot:3935801-Rhodomonas_salina.3